MVINQEKKIYYFTTAQGVLEAFEKLLSTKSAYQYSTRRARKGEQATLVLKCLDETFWVDTMPDTDLYKLLYKNSFESEKCSQFPGLFEGLHGLVAAQVSTYYAEKSPRLSC